MASYGGEDDGDANSDQKSSGPHWPVIRRPPGGTDVATTSSIFPPSVGVGVDSPSGADQVDVKARLDVPVVDDTPVRDEDVDVSGGEVGRTIEQPTSVVAVEALGGVTSPTTKVLSLIHNFYRCSSSRKRPRCRSVHEVGGLI